MSNTLINIPVLPSLHVVGNNILYVDTTNNTGSTKSENNTTDSHTTHTIKVPNSKSNPLDIKPEYKVLDVSQLNKQRLYEQQQHYNTFLQKCITHLSKYFAEHCCVIYSFDNIHTLIKQYVSSNDSETKYSISCKQLCTDTIQQLKHDTVLHQTNIKVHTSDNTLLYLQPIQSHTAIQWQKSKIFVLQPIELQSFDCNTTECGIPPINEHKTLLLNRSNKKQKTKTTQTTVTVLEQRVQSLRDELHRKQQQLAKLKKDMDKRHVKYQCVDPAKTQECIDIANKWKQAAPLIVQRLQAKLSEKHKVEIPIEMIMKQLQQLGVDTTVIGWNGTANKFDLVQ